MATRSQARAARGRESEVFDAAAAIFARKGYTAATVQDLADELGLLKGSLYYYIDTKEDLLHGLLVQVHEAADELRSEVVATDLPPVDQLLFYVGRQVAWNARNLHMVSVYYNDMDRLSAERLSDLRRRRHAHEQFVTDLIAGGQADGSIRTDIDQHTLTNLVFAVVVWPYRWFRPRGALTVEQLADACTDFVRDGLGVAVS